MTIRLTAAVLVMAAALTSSASADPLLPPPGPLPQPVQDVYDLVTSMGTDVCYLHDDSDSRTPERVCAPVGDELDKLAQTSLPTPDPWDPL